MMMIWFGRAVLPDRLTSKPRKDRQQSRHVVGLFPRLHGTAARFMVMGSVGFLRGCCAGVLLRPPGRGGSRGWLLTLGWAICRAVMPSYFCGCSGAVALNHWTLPGFLYKWGIGVRERPQMVRETPELETPNWRRQTWSELGVGHPRQPWKGGPSMCRQNSLRAWGPSFQRNPTPRGLWLASFTQRAS